MFPQVLKLDKDNVGSNMAKMTIQNRDTIQLIYVLNNSYQDIRIQDSKTYLFEKLKFKEMGI